MADTDRDGLSDRAEAPGIVNYDDAGLVLFDLGVAPYIQANAPRRDTSAPADPILGWTLTDPITDPSSRDTDRDGLEDNFELTPYQNTLRSPPAPPGSLTPLLVTSREFFDSDRDTASDGVERKVGGKPRVFDLDTFGDNDGDGLVNIQETETFGYDVIVRQMRPRSTVIAQVCANGVCPAQPQSPPRKVWSDPNDSDSDDDGLSDFEEFDLKTDPKLSDTDDDGLSDFDEVRGFQLRNVGILRTDPLNQDSDNDKRSDGEEADRGSLIVVRLPGIAPYQAFSHPLNPDGDLDLLVDGDEVSFGADPTNFNTDGDNRTDYSEVLAGRRPLVPDLIIELTFGSITVTEDGEDGSGAGDIFWTLGMDRPNLPPIAPTGLAGVAGNLDRGAGDTIPLGDVTFPIGPVSTTDSHYEEFSITGVIWESGPAGINCRIDFPGAGLPVGDLPGTFPGRDLKVGLQTWNLHRVVTCNNGNTFDITLNLAYRGS